MAPPPGIPEALQFPPSCPAPDSFRMPAGPWLAGLPTRGRNGTGRVMDEKGRHPSGHFAFPVFPQFPWGRASDVGFPPASGESPYGSIAF